MLALLFVCGVGTFARTEVFVLQTRYFTVCGGYGRDYFPFSHAALFIPPIAFLFLEVVPLSLASFACSIATNGIVISATRIGPHLIARFTARPYAIGRVVSATLSSVLVLVVFALMFSGGRDSHPPQWGFYIGLVVLGWGASATYESVTAISSALTTSCFAAYFVGTYSAAIVFGPVNLATGELCVDDEARDHAVAWQLGTSALLVAVVALAFVYVSSLPGPRSEYTAIDDEVTRIVGRGAASKQKEMLPLTEEQREQLLHWIAHRHIDNDPWVHVALEMGVIEPKKWEEIGSRVGAAAGGSGGVAVNRAATAPVKTLEGGGAPAGHSSTEDAGAEEAGGKASDAAPSFVESCRSCWKPAAALLANTLVNIVTTGLYVRLGQVAVGLFYEFYLGTAIGATLTLSKALKDLGLSVVVGGVCIRTLLLPVIFFAVYHPDGVDNGVLHALNVPWAILGGWCYTMSWVKASAIVGGARVMPIVYFIGMSVGILIVIGLNEHQKSQDA